jgi:hypothetical protein
MKKNCVNETFAQALERIFANNENIVYIAVLDNDVSVIAHKGFLDIHPSKMEKLHIQALMLAKMTSLWAEDFGRVDYVGASFVNKGEVIVIPLSKRLQAVAVLSYVTDENLKRLKETIVAQFKSLD